MANISGSIYEDIHFIIDKFDLNIPPLTRMMVERNLGEYLADDSDMHMTAYYELGAGDHEVSIHVCFDMATFETIINIYHQGMAYNKSEKYSC